jgi:two-component system, NtrC family, response regulator PilR
VSESRQVLITSSDLVQCAKLAEIAAQLGMQSVGCNSLCDARAQIDRQRFEIVLCGDDLPDSNLRMSVRVLASATGGVPVIVVSHLAEWDAYLRALDAGAFDYIACPPDPAEVERILLLALGQHPPLGRASRTAA